MTTDKIIMSDNINVALHISGEVYEKFSQGGIDIDVSVNGNKYEYSSEEIVEYSAYKKCIWLEDGELARDLENWLETYPLELADEAYQQECLIKIKTEIRKVAEQVSVQAFFGEEIGEVPFAHGNNIAVWVSPEQSYSPGSPYDDITWEVYSPNKNVEISFNGVLEGEHYDSESALEEAMDFYKKNLDNVNEDYEWNASMSEQFRVCWEYSSRGWSIPSVGESISVDGSDFVYGFDNFEQETQALANQGASEEDSSPKTDALKEYFPDHDTILPGLRLLGAPQKIASDLESVYPNHLIVVSSGFFMEARGASVKMLNFKDWGSESKKNNNEPRSGMKEEAFFDYGFKRQVEGLDNYIVVGQKHDTKEIFGQDSISYQTPPIRDENNQVIREVVYMKTNGVVLEAAPEPEEKPNRSGFGGDKITKIENHVSVVFTYNDVDHELQYPATGNDVGGKITGMSNPEILKRLIDKLNEVDFNSDDDKEEVFESLLDMINHTCLNRKKRITHELGQKIEAVKGGRDLPIKKQTEDTFLTISENNSDLHGRVLEQGNEFISSPQNIARSLELQYPNHIIFIQSGKLWDVRGRSLELSSGISKKIMSPYRHWENNSQYINQSEPRDKWTEFDRRALGKTKIDLLMYEWNQNLKNYPDIQGIMVISQKQDQTLEFYGEPVKDKDGFVVRFVEEIKGSDPITTDISEHLPATPKATNTAYRNMKKQ